MTVLGKLEATLQKPLTETADGEAQAKKAAVAAAVKGTPTADQSGRILAIASKIILAIAGALGFAGVVAVTGGAVLWERFDQAGFPAERAVAAVPDDQLVVYGAEALLASAAIGLAGVAVAYAFDRWGTVSIGSLIPVSLLVLGGIVYSIFCSDLGFWAVLGLSLFAIVLALGALRIANITGVRFLPFGTAVFIAVIAFGVLLAFLQAEDSREVQPAAVVAKSGEPGVAGYYIADTPTRVYIGIPDSRLKNVNFQEIQRSDETRLLVGPAMSKSEARKVANQLLDQLGSGAPAAAAP